MLRFHEKLTSCLIRVVFFISLTFILPACSTLGKTFDQHIENNKLFAAHSLYVVNEDEFIDNPKKYNKRLDILASAFDNQLRNENSNALRSRLMEAAKNTEDPQSWKSLRISWNTLDRRIINLKKRKIYELRSELFVNMKADRMMLDSIAEMSRNTFPERIKTWDLARKENVYVEYGIGVPVNDAKALFEEKLLQDMPALIRLSESDIRRIRNVYKNIWPNKIDEIKGKSAVAASLRDAAAISERVSFVEFQIADQVAKLLGVEINSRPSDIILVGDSNGSEMPISIEFENNLTSIKTLGRNKAADIIEGPLVSPPVFIIPRATLINETLVDTVKVASSYQSANVRKANPDYIETTELLNKLKHELLEAERTLTSNSSSFDDLLDTASPDLPDGMKVLMGLAGIANQASTVKTDFKVRDLEERVASTERRLATISRMVSEPKMSRYEFEVKKANVDRHEHLTLAVFDMFSDSFDIYQVKINNEKTFRVPLGIHANDKKANAYDDLASYMAAIQNPMVIEYGELIDLVQPNSPGHLISGLPKAEFKKLLLEEKTREFEE